MYRLKLSLYGAEVTEIALESGREYVFGRAPGCDVQLEEQPGVSRQHFRVYEENGQWHARVLSKFGDLIYAGQPTQSLPLEPGTVFKLAGYDFHFAEAVANEDEEVVDLAPAPELPMVVGFPEAQPPMTQSIAHPPARIVEPAPAPFEGNDEATRIVAAVTGIPFIRIVLPSGEEETLKLEGRKWLAGREESCEILLNDRKASRRQFELVSSPQGYFIRDLGSSNGTQLNGTSLAQDELKAIRSGDVIQVGGLVLYFEVRDPNFEKKLMVIAPEVMSGLPAIQQSPYEMVNYPMPMGPGGAVRMDGGSLAPYEQAWDGDPAYVQASEKNQKQKTIRLVLIGAIVLLPILWLFSGKENSGGKPNSQTPVVANEPFARLSPVNQKKVKETFVLANNLYLQGKHALAAQQLKALHEILPEGYENSLALAEELRAQAEQEEHLKYIQEEQKRAQENARKVEENFASCERVIRTSYNLAEVQSCLGLAISLDPSNPRLAEAFAQVQQRVAERSARAANQRAFAESAGRGRSLYNKAAALERRGQYLEAIDAYKKHIASSYPDPDNLKAKSQQNSAALSKRIASQVSEALTSAERAHAAQNYREAINEIKRAKQYDPSNVRAAELNAKVRRELNLKLREIYEEGIISEGLGQVDQAKSHWKKILELDHPEGDYYKRAKNKMRAYGGA